MDIEERLNQLVMRRRVLQRGIAEQRRVLQKSGSGNTEQGIAAKPAKEQKQNAQTEKTENILSYGGQILFSQCPKENKALLALSQGEDCILLSKLSEGAHGYLYFTREWRREVFPPGNMISVRLRAENAAGNFRPIAVFLDKNREKLAHMFFAFGVPCRLPIPPECAFIQLGIRAEGPGEIILSELRFGERTLYDLCDAGFLARIAPEIAQIPESNGNRYYEPYQGKAAIIADEFLYHSFQNTADWFYVTPRNYEEAAEESAFLLLASAWHGLDHEWDDLEKPESENGRRIPLVIEAFRRRGKPVIFYSKEDPPNYDSFVWIARQCDAVFTSAEEMIPRYREECGNSSVQALCFGINPCFHNPVGMYGAGLQDGVIFSGSWMAKYPERCKRLTAIFDGVLKAGLPLKIIDRNFERKQAAYWFPEKYYRFVSPSIRHETLQRVHKLYQWAININSVTTSRTMFANRVYELQANGNLLLSNYSRGMAEKFGGVFITEQAEKTAAILRELDREEVYRRRVAGVRRVMNGETTFDRFQEIAAAAGLSYRLTERRAAVVVPERTPELEADFATQSYRNRFLITAAECSEAALAAADIVAFWSPGFRYGTHYLEDMCNGFKYTDSDYITKDAYAADGAIVPGMEHNYIGVCRHKCASVFWKAAFSWEALSRLRDGQELSNGYSIDHFEIRGV